MRHIYREKYYDCGDYREVYIYPCNALERRSGGRKPKAKPTPAAQKRVNKRESENKLIRLLNANFTADDLSFDLTYSAENHPESDEQARKDAQNFLRRLKRKRKKDGLPDLKYILVTAKGSKKGRYHHHLVISGGVSVQELARLWGLGYTKAQPLQFSETGLVGKGKYLAGQNAVGFKSFSASKNLIQPKPHKRDGRISARRIEELSRLGDDRETYEKLYEGFTFAESNNFYADSGGFYFCIRLYKKNGDFNGMKKRRLKK